MKFELRPYSIHELGQRQNQEDSIFPAYGEANAKDRLFILCDGMGGHEKGEVASATVCQIMSSVILTNWNPEEPLSDELLRNALESAYDELDEKDNGEERKMGTTLTFVCFHAEGVTVAHIGDSRVYQLRPATKQEPAKVVFRTQDHSLVNDLIKIGEITEEEAKHHPQKNVITRAMQPCQERRARADIAHLTDVREGDYFFMCSDGMLEEASDENLLFMITKPKTSNEDKVKMLINATADNKDNHTAHLINIIKVKDPVVIPSASVISSNAKEKPFDVVAGNSKKNKIFSAVIALLVIVIIALACHIFLGESKSDGNKDQEKPTLVDKKDSKKSEESNTEKNDTVKKPENQKPAEKTSDVKDNSKAGKILDGLKKKESASKETPEAPSPIKTTPTPKGKK